MNSNRYYRNFFNPPSYGRRIHEELFDKGTGQDGYVGLQQGHMNLLADIDNRRYMVLDGCELTYDGTNADISSGFYLLDGELTDVTATTITASDDDYIYYDTGLSAYTTTTDPTGISGLLIGQVSGTTAEQMITTYTYETGATKDSYTIQNFHFPSTFHQTMNVMNHVYFVSEDECADLTGTLARVKSMMPYGSVYLPSGHISLNGEFDVEYMYLYGNGTALDVTGMLLSKRYVSNIAFYSPTFTGAALRMHSVGHQFLVQGCNFDMAAGTGIEVYANNVVITSCENLDTNVYISATTADYLIIDNNHINTSSPTTNTIIYLGDRSSITNCILYNTVKIYNRGSYSNISDNYFKNLYVYTTSTSYSHLSMENNICESTGDISGSCYYLRCNNNDFPLVNLQVASGSVITDNSLGTITIDSGLTDFTVYDNSYGGTSDYRYDINNDGSKTYYINTTSGFDTWTSSLMADYDTVYLRGSIASTTSFAITNTHVTIIGENYGTQSIVLTSISGSLCKVENVKISTGTLSISGAASSITSCYISISSSLSGNTNIISITGTGVLFSNNYLNFTVNYNSGAYYCTAIYCSGQQAVITNNRIVNGTLLNAASSSSALTMFYTTGDYVIENDNTIRITGTVDVSRHYFYSSAATGCMLSNNIMYGPTYNSSYETDGGSGNVQDNNIMT